ncbi:hypothetical protein JCM8208_004817 [Rhodotorula glutinis]
MSALGPTGLARLPEELVDLVCRFVVDFQEVQDTITTLCSLALTSRHLLEPARRALLFDPTRILSKREPAHAEYLLHRIIRNPELGRQVKRLDGFVDVFDRDDDLFGGTKPVYLFTNWAFTLMRSCPNVISVVIWPDLTDGWLDELVRLPRLRHVGFQARYSMFYEDDFVYRPFNTLRTICQQGLPLESIASSCDFCAPRPYLLPAVAPRVSSVYLDHTDYGPTRVGDGIDLKHVRHLHLKAQWLFDMMRLPRGLETLVLESTQRPSRHTDPAMWEDELCWNEIFSAPDTFCALQSVRLMGARVRTSGLAQLAAAAPNLERLELHRSLWDDIDLCRPEQDAALVEILFSLPRLRFLHLGEVPCQGETILATRAHCRLFDIELEYRCEASTPSLSPIRASSPSSDLDADTPTFPSYPALHRSPSPTPQPDYGDLAAAPIVRARTAAEAQQYADAPAAQPRLEPGFEARDDGVDEELDEAAPWDGWGSECDVGEADRAWRECDDEGAWECTRALIDEED